ncbi:ras association domain-containing protein 1 isoform 1-T1 [Sarcophilus harrisii]|uniref:Ras association domain family member 1 n=3 Tax=Sarcophilus harrisii TaxID=9305 RepID=A0A7N4NVG4_SARHA
MPGPQTERGALRPDRGAELSCLGDEVSGSGGTGRQPPERGGRGRSPPEGGTGRSPDVSPNRLSSGRAFRQRFNPNGRRGSLSLVRTHRLAPRQPARLVAPLVPNPKIAACSLPRPSLQTRSSSCAPSSCRPGTPRLVSAPSGLGGVSGRRGMSDTDAGTPAFEMTWSSTTSSGYCSQEDSDSELEQYFTARTSLVRKPRRDQDEPLEWEKPVLSQTEIEQKIKEYNSQINSNLFMSLNKDGSYTGFIKVQLKLVRPVSVPATKKPPTLQDAKRTTGKNQAVKRRTSFYLPKDTVKHLHVLSRTRAREVIEALLRKFLVVDNPRKFALFERAERHDQVYLRKLSDDEQPLRLRLLAGPSEKALSFVLKENETGDVNWDAFSMPELHNFLRILQREEEEHVRQILQKYSRCRQKMQEALGARPLG